MGDNGILCVSHATCQKLKYYVPSIATLKKIQKVFRFIFDLFFSEWVSFVYTWNTALTFKDMFKWKQTTKWFYFPALLNMYEDLWIKHTDCSLCNSSASMSLEHERWLGRKKWEWFGGQKDFQDTQILLETCLSVFFK